jgi:hypothetical protein
LPLQNTDRNAPILTMGEQCGISASPFLQMGFPTANTLDDPLATIVQVLSPFLPTGRPSANTVFCPGLSGAECMPHFFLAIPIFMAQNYQGIL